MFFSTRMNFPYVYTSLISIWVGCLFTRALSWVLTPPLGNEKKKKKSVTRRVGILYSEVYSPGSLGNLGDVSNEEGKRKKANQKVMFLSSHEMKISFFLSFSFKVRLLFFLSFRWQVKVIFWVFWNMIIFYLISFILFYFEMTPHSTLLVKWTIIELELPRWLLGVFGN